MQYEHSDETLIARATRAAEPVLAAIAGRRSVRGFLDRPVPNQLVERLLASASHAPSGNNTQPWQVHVVTGATKRALTEAVMAQRSTGAAEPTPAYRYYPDQWPEPYLLRRRAVGWQLYGLLGITKGNHAAASAWHDQNFAFFDAPVGLILTIDGRLGLGAMIDVGMFAQTFMIGATAAGLATCCQAAWAPYQKELESTLGLQVDEEVLLGIALGFEDPNAVQNQLQTSRVPVRDFTTFHS